MRSFRPLVKRPVHSTYKTVLSVDGGAVRGVFSAAILVEVEQSIKRYLVDNPDLLPLHANISSEYDFDINLVDYFDCMTGFSSGTWAVLYLASRGGQGAVRTVLEDPEIVARYGVIPVGAAAALRVLFREFSEVIYPIEVNGVPTTAPLNISNPNAPGVNSPLYPLDGLERTLEAFCGNATLEDVDTSLVIPALDLVSGLGIYFVQNRFRKPAVTSTAHLTVRAGPRPPAAKGDQVSSDFVFEEGKNYFLRDIGTGAASLPALQSAKNVSQVGSDAVEFVLIDGVFPIESAELPTVTFVVDENGFDNIENVATLSVGSGRAERNFLGRANAGAVGWLAEGDLLSLYSRTGLDSLATLTDYMYYSNPDVRPNQYLRIQASAPVTTEEGVALATLTDTTFADVVEDIGRRTAQEYRESIDAFVRDFIFG